MGRGGTKYVVIIALGFGFVVVSIAIFVLIRLSKQPRQNKKPKTVTTNQGRKPIESEEHLRKAKRKGELGEYKIDVQLNQLPKDHRCLSDVLIRTSKGLTQIDHIIISPVGLYVIETKNYMGIILGKQYDKSWTQICNRQKQKMYNPIRQNYGHIQSLMEILKGFGKLEYYSIISFTRRCELKVDLDLRTIKSDIMVIYDTDLSDFISRKSSSVLRDKTNSRIEISEINKIYDLLAESNIEDVNIREEHIQEIKSKI